MADQGLHYKATKRTALTFKGEDGHAKKKRRAQKELEIPGQPKEEEGDAKVEEGEEAVPMAQGSGRVVTSHVTVHGFETKFKDELEVGDTLIIHHAVSLEVEMRIVTGILSQRSCTLHQAFSKDLVSTTDYHVRKDSLKLKEKAKATIEDTGDPEALQDATSLELQKQLEKKLKKKNKQCSVREKTGMWGYKVVTKSLSKEASQEELLDERCKQGRDKIVGSPPLCSARSWTSQHPIMPPWAAPPAVHAFLNVSGAIVGVSACGSTNATAADHANVSVDINAVIMGDVAPERPNKTAGNADAAATDGSADVTADVGTLPYPRVRSAMLVQLQVPTGGLVCSMAFAARACRRTPRARVRRVHI
eukprot:CAMPEP_0204524202 /NCGR_PEP_ID=MMETSP0661-20131031/7250_1 /ASSEMBLY_ACC=CAM_ASM_000606 /TAXON_ID=109239 /ORGANISM="Alexandrium margalefi, Strain AMGDE01CS-322" /LENGTH=361 /DNA_ID=CAMNT_0051529939 /DNA_START=47 /DNA_END=1134 /DNA_ORIENTATION=+